MRIKLILLAIVVAAIVGGVFYFAHKAETSAPEPQEMRMEAKNVDLF
mgnify:CR=1 FL=1